MRIQKAADGTGSLDKALDVLDAVGRAPRGISQADLAQQLELPRTTLYRILGTLVERGLLRRDPQRRVFGIGLRCFEYVRLAYAMPDLAAAASAELRALRDLTGETSYLAVLDGVEVLSLERYDGAHSERSQAALGQRKPLHCTSQGKAILSALPATQRDALIKSITLTPMTPHTLNDRRRLQAELRLTAARGWSIDDEEIVLGVRCCGAPIVDATGRVRGAISVAGPAFRMTRERVDLIGPEVAQAARRIAAELPLTEHLAPSGPVQPVAGEWAFRGAFPQWSSREQCLYWADTLAPTIHRADEAGDRSIARMEAPIGSMLLLADGSLRIRVDGRWSSLAADGSLEPCSDMPRRPMPASALGPGGQLWVCQPDGDRWRAGAWQGDGLASAGWSFARPIGAMVWSPDGSALYAVETDADEILVMRPDSPAVRRFAAVSKGSGRPVALAVDGQGGVWSAMRDGWSVIRHAPDGQLDRVVGLPVPSPTGLAIGGTDGHRLFVTSDRESLALETLGHAPLAGRLFVVDLTRPDAEP